MLLACGTLNYDVLITRIQLIFKHFKDKKLIFLNLNLKPADRF